MVFDVSPIGMSLLSLDGRFIRVNRAMGRSVGYAEGELVGRTFETVRHEADRAPDDDQVERCLAGEIDGYEIDRLYRAIAVDNPERYVLLDVGDLSPQETAEALGRTVNALMDRQAIPTMKGKAA